MIKKEIQSGALQANLEQTRTDKLVIPLDYQCIIDFSASHPGILERTRECVEEYFHPYSNREVVVSLLRQLLLSDFWFFSAAPDSVTFRQRFCDMAGTILEEKVDESIKINLLRTLLEFVDKLLADDADTGAELVYVLEVIAKKQEVASHAYMYCTNWFSKHLGVVNISGEAAILSGEILKNVFTAHLIFWRDTSRIEDWYTSREAMLVKDSSEDIKSLNRDFFMGYLKAIEESEDIHQSIHTIPAYGDIAIEFRRFAQTFSDFSDRFYYTFYLLHLPGMAHLYTRLLGDINRLLKNLLTTLPSTRLDGFIQELFELFGEFREHHMDGILDCIQTAGVEIIRRDDSENRWLVNQFEKRLIQFGFETPGLAYVGKDWKTHINPNHLKNIRVWLEIIESSAVIPEKLLAALIVNLRLGGIYINDTDLFQRDITKILNSNIAPLYKKVKQLTRIFPVYFNEIGAEGEIREVTTSMDELSHRNDKLIHFLRKQVHIESNNTLIELTRRVLLLWYSGKREPFKPYLPVDVYASIDVKGPWFLPMHHMVVQLCEKSSVRPEQLFLLEREKQRKLVNGLDAPKMHKTRILNLFQLYNLLKEKYSFDSVNIISDLRQVAIFTEPEIVRLEKAFSAGDHLKALEVVYSFMQHLNEIIFDTQRTEGWENIYHKRHIAFGIPSMYGTYREPKFEALGLTFRLEKVASRLIEQAIAQINLEYISANTLGRIYAILKMFRQGLELDGVTNQSFNSNLQMLRYSLTSASFSLTQYINIFGFMSGSIREIINKYFIRTYEYPLNVIVPGLFDPRGECDEPSRKKLIAEKSEAFFRDIISSAFLLQTLDNFINSVLHSLNRMVDNYSVDILQDAMSYNADLIVTSFDKPSELIDNQIFLGSKAYFLKKLYLSNFPVPPGFVLTTEVFRRLRAIKQMDYMYAEMRHKVEMELRHLEKLTGMQYGNLTHPLLLSVRSGTAISMPGAMDTFLNVGMNDEIALALSRKPGFGWAAWDCYRRFIQSWGMAHGINRDLFDEAIAKIKADYSVASKSMLSESQMQQVTEAYKQILSSQGIVFETNLVKQLEVTINTVFESWSSERASVYRKNMQVAPEWGTAVIVQQMVFGNLSSNSGTGVVFTHNPLRQRPGVHLFGDFSRNNQGEDVVSGLVHVLPVNNTQRKQLELNLPTMQDLFPEVYKRLYAIAVEMTEKHGFSHQEIEFTFESDQPESLYILQSRDQEIQKPAAVSSFAVDGEKHTVGKGIGAGGGALNGILVFNMEDMQLRKSAAPNEHYILVRPDTVPDDIGMIFECDGLITARGGVTSHAAVAASRLGKVCIVNCREMVVSESEQFCEINGVVLNSGDKVAIDGSLGIIYSGHYMLVENQSFSDTFNQY
ncbi:MAG: PEP/pyruvate-binding domain-containing protein [Bacteroidales bacterium]|nr:PEP/pyruvate-binding domain-containing protein [Bacteroidales bacterium]HPE85787.1 PEP/pyruvate-binding domain-containing protein [Bacteroidales bacterium]